MDEEFRVEVELDDPEHGYSIGERLRAAELDDDARERLGRKIMVTRDGSRLFLYATTEADAHEAERVVQELAASDELTADVRVTRWHPVEEAWKDISVPLPATSAEQETERAARETAEAREAEIEGEFDWHVIVHLAGRSDAVTLADRLATEGAAVRRRWRYVTVGVLTEEDAWDLADRLRAELPDDADIRVEANLSDVAHSPLQFLPF